MEAEKLFLLFSLLRLQFSSCTSQDSLKTNQTIKEGDVLISEGNNFALGFFSPGSSTNRYLGIWYHKIPEQTVVWVANRNDPIIGSSGFLFINQYGNLVLYGNDDQKLPVWSPNVSVEENDTCEAQLLDSGNLILVSKRSRKTVWQSFDYPTNVLLPGMKLGLDRKLGIDRFLISWRSAEDPGIGDFSVRINPNGSPQFFVYNGTKPIFRSRPWPWRRHTGIFQSVFVNDPDEIYCESTVPDGYYPVIRIVDHSGLSKVLTWRESDGQWKEYWRYPQFQCDYYGYCGAYSTCELANYNKFGCACLPGFEPKYPKEWSIRDGSGGCVRKRLQTSSVCDHGEGFVKVEKVVLPDTSAAAWVDMSRSRADCEVECKRNCSCSAYAVIVIPGKGDGCLNWYKELVDFKYDRIGSHDLYVRVDAYEFAGNKRKLNGSREKTMLAILALLLFLISLSSYLRLKKRAKKGTEPQANSNSTESECFKLSTIMAATNNFSPANELGQGGFGSVYKGLLANGLEVAIKRLSRSSGQGTEEFKNEVMVIAKLQHRNLVKLLGYCNQDGEQMLIYEYLPNKSLDSFLFDESRRLLLDWRKRFDIIVGIARGILYLHQDSRLRIIHRDLKCSNILLHAEMNPKISDFGMAKIFEGNQTEDRTRRVIVDHSGLAKVLTWRESDGQWKDYWKAPQFQCDYYGQCGAYSTCELASYYTFGCACLPGYEPKYPMEWSVREGSGGCVRKRLQTSSVCDHGEGFVKVENVTLPDTSAAAWVDTSKSRADCEVECKSNCSCSAYAVIVIPGKEDGCLNWYNELVDIRYDKSESRDLYVRVDAYELAGNKRKLIGSREKTMLAILAPSIAVLLFLISLSSYLRLKKRAKEGTELQANCNSTESECFKLSTITAATNNFSPANKLGQGGFGSVYKGLLANGMEVAIKRLSRSSGQGTEEFKNEVTVIAMLQHRNLVKLLGYCNEDGEQMLIYEYLPNKSLDSFLFHESRRLLLDWRKRFDIIVGIARGILYLHQDSRLRIIHRDLKCSNILLDAEMNPKISDFGMAKIFEGNQTEDRTRRVVGTFGYMSPEYAVLGNFSVKSDVFSFGVMLLEIVSGKKNNRFYQQDPPLTLIGHVWELWREEKALEIVDPSLTELYDPREALKCIQIGLLCVQEDATDRPSMLAVVFMLSNETEIPSPKQPAFLFRKSDKFPDIALDVEDEQCSVNEVTITEFACR